MIERRIQFWPRNTSERVHLLFYNGPTMPDDAPDQFTDWTKAFQDHRFYKDIDC